MSNIGSNLPQQIQEIGHEVRIFTPRWGFINIRRHQLHEVIRLTGMNLIIDDTDHPLIIRVASLQSASRLQAFFIDNDDYFQDRMMTCDENGVEYSDNDERAIFFARGVLETVKKQLWTPSVIHCHGWISALVSLYVKSAYSDEPSFRDSKVVISLYDDDFNFKQPLPAEFLQKVLHKKMDAGLLEEVAAPITYEEYIKLAIRYSDGVIENGDNIPSSLLDYARSLGKPVLSKPSDEEYVSACSNFYESLM